MLSRLLRHSAAATILTAAVTAPLTAQSGTSASAQADMKEMQEYRLATATLAKLGQVQDNIYTMLKAHPDLAKRYASQKDDDEDEAKTLDEMAKRLDRVPELKRAIVNAGLTPRQYMLATMALIQAGMAAAVMEMPGADKSKIGPAVQANITFLKAHKAEMDRMQARTRDIEKLSRQAPGEEPGSALKPDTTGSPRP